MGLFLCDLCDQHLGVAPHVCEPADIRKHVQTLELRAQVAERKWDDIRNAVFMLLQSLPTLVGESAVVETEWLRKLWAAAECRHYEARTADDFSLRWMATHNVLRFAFGLFRSKANGKVATRLERLQSLRKACNHAKEVLGYQSSVFDVSPEELAQ